MTTLLIAGTEDTDQWIDSEFMTMELKLWRKDLLPDRHDVRHALTRQPTIFR